MNRVSAVIADRGRVSAVIADDEPLLRAQLRTRLARLWPELRVVHEMPDGRDVDGVIGAHAPSLFFLDIHMPGVNGLEAARAIGELAHVVFVTAYDRYAVQAFERGAVDYVLKPVAAERIAQTVARLRARLAAPPARMDALVDELARRIAPGPESLQWLQASLGNALKLIHVDDVLYFRSDTKYTRVVTREGEALVKKPLRELAQELDPRHFWQVHRATIVNVRAVASVVADDTGRREIALKGRPERLEVSRGYAHRFKSS